MPARALIRRTAPQLWAAAAALFVPLGVTAQQVADTAYAPVIERATHPAGGGPLVVIDGGHNNFHTVDGRYSPFAALLRRDGWRVAGSDGAITPASLAPVRVLVIANPLADRNVDDWSLPTPSAFTTDEIDAIEAWVHAGGSLLLIADHMPFPGAAGALARRIGFEMRNGFAVRPAARGPIVFRRQDGSLRLDALATADGALPAIDSVASFTGQAFRALRDDARPILILPDDAVSLEPDVAWQFDDDTAEHAVGGWLQGAALEPGEGRIVVMGEAAMFSAQLAGAQRTPMGMNAPVAGQNHLLALAIVRWLGQ